MAPRPTYTIDERSRQTQPKRHHHPVPRDQPTHRERPPHQTQLAYRDRQVDATEPAFTTGTTIVGVSLEETAILAADQRMSLGGRVVANKNTQKVEQVHPSAAVAISGTVGPAQQYMQALRAEAQLYESRRGDSMSVHALAQAAGNVVRGLPVSSILGGVDDSGAHLYELDGSGAVLEDTYAAGGSGMQVAYGVLERAFDADLDREAAVRAAVAAVDVASERDTASGNGVHVATLTERGVEITDRDAPAEAA